MQSPAESPDVFEYLIDSIARHFVPITWVDVPRSGTQSIKHAERTFAVSGFVVSVCGNWFLVTAGHILEGIRARQSADRRLISCHIIDGFANNCQLQPIPFDMCSANVVHCDIEGVDYALVELRPIYVEQLKAGGVIPVSEALWRGPTSETATRCVVGLPSSLKTVTANSRGKQLKVQIAAQLVCLPLYPADDVPEVLTSNRDKRLYSRVPIAQSEAGHIDDIDGLSGSPVVEVTRSANGEYSYRVVGIQSSWTPTQRIASATRLEPVLNDLASELSRRSPAS